jgi:hypothetical protein
VITAAFLCNRHPRTTGGDVMMMDTAVKRFIEQSPIAADLRTNE